MPAAWSGSAMTWCPRGQFKGTMEEMVKEQRPRRELNAGALGFVFSAICVQTVSATSVQFDKPVTLSGRNKGMYAALSLETVWS